MFASCGIEIRKVGNKRELKKFIRFNYELYKDCPYSVPDLYEDMLTTFSEKNAAMEFCEADYFLAFRKEEVVGRVAAIINHRANETWHRKAVRFGWLDFIDDTAVSRALIDTVRAWGAERGMTEMEGPLGFTDFDAEGVLIEGFEELSTFVASYNYAYYSRHLEALGMQKASDWVEMKIYIPDAVPEKHKRISDIVARKYGLHVRKLKNKREVMRSGVAHEVFRLINEAYTPLFGFSRMTERQIDQYVRSYIPLLDLRMLTLVENEQNELVAVGLSMPSIARALQKAKGKLFPFGWWHLLKALFWKRAKVLELLLVAVRPDYQNKGINALLFTDLIPIYQQMGFEYAESNLEMETNERVQSQWQYFKVEQHKKRRCYRQSITNNR